VLWSYGVSSHNVDGKFSRLVVERKLRGALPLLVSKRSTKLYATRFRA